MVVYMYHTTIECSNETTWNWAADINVAAAEIDPRKSIGFRACSVDTRPHRWLKISIRRVAITDQKIFEPSGCRS